MGTKIKAGGGAAFAPCPEGNHAGRVVGVVYMGTVPVEFNGETTHKAQIRLSFEIPSELMENGEPFVVSTMPMTASTNKKAAFRKLALGILGREPGDDFDWEELLGKTCLVNIVHTASKKDANVLYANITGTSPLPKGMDVPEAVTTISSFDINTSTLDDMLELPDFLQEKIKTSSEYLARVDKGEEAPF